MRAKVKSHAIIYLRVDPEDKARMQALADRDFEGSMAACFRYMIDAHVRAAKPARSLRSSVGDLDED